MMKRKQLLLGLLFACFTSVAMAQDDTSVVEALLRLEDGATLVADNNDVRKSVDRYLDGCRGQRAFLDVVSKLRMPNQTDALLDFLQPEVDTSLQVEAVRLLVESKETNRLQQRLAVGDATAVAIADALGFISNAESMKILQPLVTAELPVPVRIGATKALGRTREGQQFLVSLHRDETLPRDCRFVAYDALMTSTVDECRTVAAELKPPASTSGETLPPIAKLIKMRGDGKNGKLVFKGKATCANCHKVHGEGKEVGPDLSEIGSKLSREAMYTAILNPNAGISHNYEQYAVLTADGLVLNGLLVNKDDAGVTIKTAEGVERKVATDDIEEFRKSETSLMPENLHQQISVQQLLDLVDYLVLLRKADERGFHVLNAESKSNKATSRATADATKGLTVADGLAAKLFSGEPDVKNPSNIDVDHLGRVWVCEVVNYRHFRNPYNPVREEGDRILVLEDTNGDAVADKTTVFHQGTDVNSAHGICCLGDRVIISAGDSIFALFDDDGDLKSDRKELLFTGIGGVEHDHGIHAMVPGPDGKLYFNFGNEGGQLHGPDGKVIVDQSGREVSSHGKPYQQGMVFRCDVGGTNVETLAWNFRNNWEVCVDSFGTMWQSDNDDDGNRATRINYVMPYGNYGYRDERNGDTWLVPRTGMHQNVSLRHWHLNDPGVIPNVIPTGAGSPTGITVYEGDLLPKRYRGQLLHCDPGPNSLRMYSIKNDGAGYTGTKHEVLTGSTDKWFRPVDVCVAPDGSLIVADWYDPGVGGHRMGDTERGRLFRVAPPNHASEYKTARHDFESVGGAIEALKSPNATTRYLAAKKLRAEGDSAEPMVLQAIALANDTAYQARLLWVLASWNPSDAVEIAAKNADERIRCVGVRIEVQHGMDPVDTVNRFASDASPQVRREAVLALVGEVREEAAKAWTQLALQHDGEDRWYLEALGIAAVGNWDACMKHWQASVGENWDTPAGRDIIWRSRANSSSELLAKVITESSDKQNSLRYFRALDFQPETPNKNEALKSIVVQAASLQQKNPN